MKNFVLFIVLFFKIFPTLKIKILFTCKSLKNDTRSQASNTRLSLIGTEIKELGVVQCKVSIDETSNNSLVLSSFEMLCK